MKVIFNHSSLVFAKKHESAAVLSIVETITGKYINTSGGFESSGTKNIAVYDISNYIGRKITVNIPKTVTSYGNSLGYMRLTSDNRSVIVNSDYVGDEAEHTYNFILDKGYKYLYVCYNNTANAPSVTIDAGRVMNIAYVAESKTIDKCYIDYKGILKVDNYARSAEFFEIGDNTSMNVYIPQTPSSSGLVYCFADNLNDTRFEVPSTPIFGDLNPLSLTIDLTQTTKKYLVVSYTTERGNIGVTD